MVYLYGGNPFSRPSEPPAAAHSTQGDSHGRKTEPQKQDARVPTEGHVTTVQNGQSQTQNSGLHSCAVKEKGREVVSLKISAMGVDDCDYRRPWAEGKQKWEEAVGR